MKWVWTVNGGFYLIRLDFSKKNTCRPLFISCRPFWILPAILDFVGRCFYSVWKVAYKFKIYLPGPNFTPFLPQTHRFWDIPVSNFIMQSLSMKISQGLSLSSFSHSLSYSSSQHPEEVLLVQFSQWLCAQKWHKTESIPLCNYNCFF